MPRMDDLPDYLRDRGFKVVGVPGWRTRGRPRRTGGYSPKGVVAHHTGGKPNGMAYAAGLLANGYPGLPGPLCQLALNRHGTVIFIADGRANHAGKVRKVGFLKAGDGNAQALGIEAMNTGTEGWDTPYEQNPFGTQYDAYVRLVAAVEDFMGWERGTVLGHGECSTSGKWDPGERVNGRNQMIDMAAFREAAKAVNFDPEPEPEPTPEPKPSKRWFKIALVNHGAATAALIKPTGAARWLKRRKKLVTEVRSINADVIIGIECGGSKGANPWHYISTKYRQFGYQLVPRGKEGRHIWVRPGIPVLASGAIDTPKHLRAKKNNVPAPWVIAEFDGTPGLVVGYHLDFRATDMQRVNLAKHIISEAEKIAARYDIGRSRIVFAGDSASDNWVRDKAFKPAGYLDAMDAAPNPVNKPIKSYNQYRPPVEGPRVDGIYVHQSRPVKAVSQRLTLATDHHHQAAVIHRQ